MIELSRHIEILLLRNDCVIVPDFGGFMAHHIDARRDEYGLFVPPTRTIGFNPQLRLNDSLLAQSYAEAYDSSYPEAVRRIESEVNELRQHLENEGSYELGNIGTLTLNEDHHYLFEPCEAGILTPDLYGLTTFEMKPLGEQQEQRTEKMVKGEKTAENEVEEQSAPHSPLHAALPQPDDDDDYIRIPRRWVRNAAAAAVAVIAVLVLSMPLANSGLRELATTRFHGNETFKPMAQEQKMPAKVEAKKAEAKPATEPQAEPQPLPVEASSAEPVESIAEEKEEQQASPAKGYCIVLASHVTRKNAQSFVQQLHRDGLLEATVYVKNNIVRVVYKNFETEADAQNDLNMLRGEVYFDDAWVMKM